MIAGSLALCVLVAGTSGTRSSWTSGQVVSTGTALSGTVAFTHAYQSTSCSAPARTGGSQACAGSIGPTAAATSGGVSATDSLSNNGTVGSSQLQSQVSAASCAVVRLDDRKAALNPLLPRYGTAFHTSGGPMDGAGYLTLDGGGPGGYATSVVASSQPGGVLASAGAVSGVGVWFNASSGTTGPLLSFGASPSNGAGSVDRALYLDSAGKLNLVWNTSGTKIGPSTSSYADNTWHFAYMTFGGVNVAVIGLIPQVTLWVDGTQQATTPLVSLAPISSYTGYWHLGWAPVSVTGLASAYLGASLSNLVVINSGTIPSGSTIGKPTTQAAFNTATGGSTDHWVLDDSGVTTFGGALPATMNSPCAQVTLDWAFSSPSGTVASTTPLSTFADGSWRTVTAPAPGGTQTSTITLKQGAGYSADVSGLHLYAPLSHRVQTLPAGSAWSQVFSWTASGAAFIA